ncbi:RDD family protein [Tessaracoccus sp. OS52]|uniref:RDD family protein n=1 Tax=Tessaracoccus sp. OS52 TaxID=2886691 RepID=UPI001D100B4E|nr:RDD family protein [Tessaracoccus sp. OS52]
MSRFIPRGVAVAGIGKRFLAAVIDALPIALVGGVLALVLQVLDSPTVVLVAGIAAAVLCGGYGLVQWWAYGSRGAGLGARAMGLRLVGIGDGRPIGWWRFFLRQLIFGALMATVVGGIALLVFLVIHERRQGWHDMAVRAVLVEPRPDASASERSTQARRGNSGRTVGLPPHLSSAFAPGGSGPQESRESWGSYAPKDESPAPPPWMPHLETEPIIATRPSSGDRQAGPNGALPSQRPPVAAGGQGGQPAQQPWGKPSRAAGQIGDPLVQPTAPFVPAPAQQQHSAPAQQPPVPPHQATPPVRVNQGWIPLPTPSSVIEPPGQGGAPETPRVRQRDFGAVEEDDDGTRIAKPLGNDGARPGDEGWYIRLDDGREVELNVTVLLGRNPQKTQGDPDVHLVPSGGDGRMISRTHVLIATDPRGVYVVDRGSTNGTALVTQGGELEPCPVGTQVRVKEGQQVSYGNRWFTVLRRPQRA